MIIDIAIICPIEVEFKIIRKILNTPISVSASRDQHSLSFDYGTVKGDQFIWNVAIVEPDFNATSFEMKTNEVLQVLNPKYVFLAGVAGGIKDAAIGDMVIGTKAYAYERGKETPGGFAARPDAIKNESKGLLNLARKVAREMEPKFKVFFGPIASGSKVIASTDSETYQIIKLHYNDTLAVETEAHGFSLMATKYKASYLNVRGISDLIDNKTKSDEKGHQERTTERVAFFLSKMIRKLPLEQKTMDRSIKVFYTRKAHSFFNWRKNNEGELQFNKDFIKLISNGQSVLIRNLLEVKHVRMSGDFSKSWVKVKYKYDNAVSVIYFSNAKLLGLSFLTGGSKHVFEAFKVFEKKQIRFDHNA